MAQRKGGNVLEVNRLTLIKVGGNFRLPYSTLLTVQITWKGMVMKCTAVCLVALSLLCSFCDGQWRDIYRPSPRAYPIPRATLTKPNTQTSQDVQQSTQISKPLTWHYPPPPKTESIPVGPYQPRYPVPAASVAVDCREKDAHVEVKEDLFGNGQLINPADLTLGTCAATAEDTVAYVLIFEVELQDCGSTLSVRIMKMSFITK